MSKSSVVVQQAHQKEAGADKLPAQPPVSAGPVANHLFDIITEAIDSFKTECEPQNNLINCFLTFEEKNTFCMESM